MERNKINAQTNNEKRKEGTGMKRKFIKARKIAIPALAAILMATQFTGCTGKKEEAVMKVLEDSGEEPEKTGLDSSAKAEGESGTGNRKEPEIEWTELASLNTSPEIREAWDTAAGIQKTDKGKEGMFYMNSKGENDNNNTLMQAMKTSTDTPMSPMSPMSALSMYANIDDTGEPTVAIRAPFVKAVLDQYTDIDEADEGKAFLAGLNSYYNLLPNTNKDTSESNIDTSLSRKEFMAMVYRADTPVQKISQDKEFTKAVGKSVYNEYAQNLKNNSYLTVESGDLNPTTYDGAISKAEAIYMLVNRYYQDELVYTCSDEGAMNYITSATGDKTELTFTDAKLNKDLGIKGGLEVLNKSLEDIDIGLSPDLYASLVVAAKHNIINPEEDTCWDETVSTAEAMELLIKTYNHMSKATVEAEANTEVFVTKEEQEEAEIEQLKEEYEQAVASGEVGSTDSKAYQALIGLIHKSPEEYAGNAGGLYPGYNLEIDSNGVHYLVSVMDSSAEIHIGEFTVQGVQYIGEEGCDADYVYWIRFCNPGLDKTDEEIIAGRH